MVSYSLNREEAGEVLEGNTVWSMKTQRLAGGKGVGSKWSPSISLSERTYVSRGMIRPFGCRERSIYVKLNLENRRQ